MSRNQNPFEPPQQLDSNPFEPENNSANPFNHPNDSAFSLESNDTERPGARAAGAGYGYGAGRGAGVGAGGDAELNARIAAVEARERAVREREEAVGLKENNWPPFYPIIHHSPNELPEAHRRVGKFLYIQWMALAVTLILNLVACILFQFIGHGFGALIGAVLYVPFIGILSFVLWYRPIYLGLERTEGRAMAFFFYTYFIFGGIHLLFSLYMLIGLPYTGSAGIFNFIDALFSGSIVVPIFAILALLGWAFQCAFGGYLYKKIWDFKRGNGDINFAMATDQFKRSTIKNIILHQSRV